jgi:phage baseplate assembly protein W
MAQGIAIKLPLEVDSVDGPFSLHKTELEAIQQNLKMLLLTSPGERIMVPDYGIGIRNFLFSQNTESLIRDIQDTIANQISKFMPYIKINDIEVGSPELSAGSVFIDKNIIEIRISYFVPNLRLGNVLRLPVSG